MIFHGNEALSEGKRKLEELIDAEFHQKGERGSMSEDIVSGYKWLDTSRYLGGCITYVRSHEEDEVLRRFGGDLTTSQTMTLRDVYEAQMEEDLPYGASSMVLADTIGEWVVIYEDVGIQGIRNEVLRQVSRGTEMVSVSWTQTIDQFVYAVDGEIVTRFEPLAPYRRSGSDPDRLNSYMADLPFKPGNAVKSALVLAERITNVVFEPDWFYTERRCVVVTPLPKEPYSEAKPEQTPIARSHPEMFTAIRNTSAIVQRQIALLAAERAATESGLDSDQTVRDVFEALRHLVSDLTSTRANLVPLMQQLEREDDLARERMNTELGQQPLRWEKIDGPPILSGGAELKPIARLHVDETRQQTKSYQEYQKVHRQTLAGYAIYNALLPDPLMAALLAVYDASLAISDKDGLFRDLISMTTRSPEQ
jgi:Family of unknown function (DUF6461)